MPTTEQDEEFENGVLKRRTPRTVSDQEIERRESGAGLRQALPTLRLWAGDAQDVAALTAMTAPQRLARQAVIENRVAIMARLILKLIWKAGEDDGG